MIYFEAIAITDIHPRNIRFVNALGGVMIRISMSAVIYTESILLGALKAHASKAFEKKQTAVMKTAETKRSVGLKLNNLKKLRQKAPAKGRRRK
jgi:hypothetical protein